MPAHLLGSGPNNRTVLRRSKDVAPSHRSTVAPSHRRTTALPLAFKSRRAAARWKPWVSTHGYWHPSDPSRVATIGLAHKNPWKYWACFYANRRSAGDPSLRSTQTTLPSRLLRSKIAISVTDASLAQW